MVFRDPLSSYIRLNDFPKPNILEFYQGFGWQNVGFCTTECRFAARGIISISSHFARKKHYVCNLHVPGSSIVKKID